MKIRVLINEVDVTSKVLERGFTITDTEGSDIDTLFLTIDDTDASLTINEAMDVIVENWDDNTDRLFGGIIVNVDETIPGINTVYNITAQDWKMLLDRTSIDKSYKLTSDYDIIQDAFSEAGLSEIDASEIDTISEEINRLDFMGVSLRSVMSTISDLTGGVWNVTPFKKLTYHSPGEVSASFVVSTTGSSVVNALSRPFYNVARNREIMGFNSVKVYGALTLSDDVTNVYSGDGSRTFFNIVTDGKVSGNDYFAIQEPEEDRDRVRVQVNEGTDGSPDWGSEDGINVGLEGQDALQLKDALYNPLTLQIKFREAPPNFANNSWRMHGRYRGRIVAYLPDVESINNVGGREFLRTIHDRSIKSQEHAENIAMAFIREQGNQHRLTFSTDIGDRYLTAGSTILITHARYGYSFIKFDIQRVSTHILGGEVIEQRVQARRSREYD